MSKLNPLKQPFARHALAAAVGLVSGNAAAADAIVTNLSDSGPGSLRDAIQIATGDGGVPSIVTFSEGVSGTITLSTDLPVIEDDIEIVGPGITLRGTDGLESRSLLRFRSDGAVTHIVRGLTFKSGNNAAIDAELYGSGSLVIEDAVITGSKGRPAVVALYGEVLVDRSEISGNTNQPFPGEGDGGGIDVRYVDLTVRDSLISNNKAGDDGAGINAWSSDILIERSVIRDNVAGDDGGAIRARGFNSFEVDVNSSTVSGNVAGGTGGGIQVYSYDGASLEVRNSAILSNRASNSQDGGGVYFRTGYSDTSSNVLLSGVVMQGNKAGRGGGAHVITSNFALEDSRVEGNVAARNGGGLQLGVDNASIVRSTIADNEADRYAAARVSARRIDGLEVTMDSTTVSGNTSSVSHALEVYVGYQGSMDMSNSTISGNSAEGFAMLVTASPNTNAADLDIRNSTFSGNRSTSLPTAIAVRGMDVTVHHATFVNNQGKAGNGLSSSQLGVYRGNKMTVSANLQQSIFTSGNDTEVQIGRPFESIYGGDEPGLVSGNIGFIIMTNGIQVDEGSTLTGGTPSQVDPDLAPLGYRGGLTLVHEPNPGSPAIESGSEGTRTDGRDQRGLVGNVGFSSDLGAVEVVGNTPPRLVKGLATQIGGLVDTTIPGVNVLDFFTDDDGDGVSVQSIEGLPPGLTHAGGVISGTLETPGSFLVTATVTDDNANPLVAVEQFVVTVKEQGGGGGSSSGGGLSLGGLALFGFLARLRRRPA